MAAEEHRTFQDRDGNKWEIRAVEDFKWHFEPGKANPRARKIITPPPNVDDPAALSEEELQNLLDGGIPTDGVTEPLRSGED